MWGFEASGQMTVGAPPTPNLFIVLFSEKGVHHEPHFSTVGNDLKSTHGVGAGPFHDSVYAAGGDVFF